MPKIQFRRGTEANLPKLATGEPAFTMDTEKLFIGGPTGNVEFPKKEDIESLQEQVETIDGELSETNQRFNELQLVDANAEVLAARGGEATLGVRLDKVTSDLAEMTTLPKGLAGNGIANDTTAIKNAIAEATNGRLFIPENKTILITDQLVLSSPITIIMGKNSTFKSGYVPSSNAEPLIKITSSDVHLIDVSIDGQMNDHLGILAQNVSKVSIDGGTVRGVGIVSAIKFDTVTDSSIKNVTVGGNKSGIGSTSLGAIYADNCSNLMIQGNRIDGFYGKGVGLRNTVKSVISHCIVHDLFTDYADCIYLGYNCVNVSVSDCVVYNTPGNGIKLSRQAKYCTVSGCSVSGSIGANAYGILLQGVLHCSVEYCKVSIDGDVIAICIEDHPMPEGGNGEHNKVTHNSVISATTSKPVIITQIHDVFLTTDTEISFNTVKGGYIGIAAYSTRSKIIGNTILGVTNIGISNRYNGDYTDILDNTVDGNANIQAIYVQFATVKKGINVCRNRINNAAYNALVINNITESNINDNQIYGTSASGTSGISVQAGVTEVNIHSNLIDGFAIAGIYCERPTATGISVCMNQVINVPAGNYIWVNVSSGTIIGNTKKNSGAIYAPAQANVVNLGNAA